MRLFTSSIPTVARLFQRVAIAAVISMVPSSIAFAQCPTTATATGTVSSASVTICMQVKDVLRITYTSSSTALNSPTKVNYGAVAANAYLTSATPLAASAGPTLSVVANRGYQITVAAATANFSTAPSGVTKPSSDIQWKSSSTSFVALTTSGAAALTGVAALTATSTTLSFQTRWAFERDKPGSYSTGVLITLAGN